MSEEICDICEAPMNKIAVPFTGFNIHSCKNCNANIDIGKFISNTDWDAMYTRV